MKAIERGALPEGAALSPARRRLFETAVALFSREGYNRVSVRDIAKEMDQHPTAIYAHVSSKQELLFELVRLGHEELRDRMRLALLESGSEPADQLRAIVYASTLTHLSIPELARICQSEVASLSQEQAAVISALAFDMGALLRDVINRGVGRGTFQPLDMEITVAAVIAMSVRVIDFWVPGSGQSATHVAGTQAELAVRMLTP